MSVCICVLCAFLILELLFFQGRVRVLALIVKLFSTSSAVATLVYNSKLLGLLEAEIRNVNDTLITLSVLELLYEVCHHSLL